MEMTPRSADNMGLASALTALNVVVASSFSIAGLIKPEPTPGVWLRRSEPTPELRHKLPPK